MKQQLLELNYELDLKKGLIENICNVFEIINYQESNLMLSYSQQGYAITISKDSLNKPNIQENNNQIKILYRMLYIPKLPLNKNEIEDKIKIALKEYLKVELLKSLDRQFIIMTLRQNLI